MFSFLLTTAKLRKKYHIKYAQRYFRVLQEIRWKAILDRVNQEQKVEASLCMCDQVIGGNRFFNCLTFNHVEGICQTLANFSD